MIDDYGRLIDDSVRSPIPSVPLPPHLLDDGSRLLDDVAAHFGIQLLSR